MDFQKLSEKITPKTVVDAGANVGHWHNEARLHWPDAHFIEIEGNPACEEQLRGTGAETHIILLSDAEKEITFYRRKDAPSCTGCSAYRENTEFYADDKIETVVLPATTLDKLLEGRQLVLPILLKLDLQGAELDALDGAKYFLSVVSWIVMEVSLENYNEGSPLFNEVDEYMRAAGFYLLCELGYITHPCDSSRVIQKDVLYIR